MNLLSTAFALIFIAIVALASFWLKEEVINEYKNFTLSKNSGPSFFLKDFDSTKTDEDGNLQSSLQAEFMKHFKGEDKTSLFKPSILNIKIKKNIRLFIVMWVRSMTRGSKLSSKKMRFL